MTSVSGEDEARYESRLTPSRWQSDVRVDTAGRPPAGWQRYRAQLAQAAKDLRARPDDPQARYRHAQACFRLGRDLEAVAGLSALIRGAVRAGLSAARAGLRSPRQGR
jgi:hypothetical protein